MKLRVLVIVAALLTAALPSAAEAPHWSLEEGSLVGFIAMQSGAPVKGIFESFEAEILFQEDALDQSRVAVTIDIASVNSDNKERDDAIRASGLFDAAQWPTARFEAEGFTHKGGSDYEAAGKLTLRDVTRDVVLPFTLEIVPHPDNADARLASAKGELAVQRLDYGVGQGLWSDTTIVGDEVVIFIDIKAVWPKG